jgi:hypothetical protein
MYYEKYGKFIWTPPFEKSLIPPVGVVAITSNIVLNVYNL